MSLRKIINVTTFVVTGLIIIAFVFLVTSPSVLSDLLNRDYKNVDVVFFDRSEFRDNPSGKLIIDGEEVYRTDSISKSISKESKIRLSKGKHIIEISTADDKYRLKDTIKVKGYPATYRLWVTYKFSPSFVIYKKQLVEKYYQKRIRNNKLTSAQKNVIYGQIYRSISNELNNDTSYKEIPAKFTYIFSDDINSLSDFSIED